MIQFKIKLKLNGRIEFLQCRRKSGLLRHTIKVVRCKNTWNIWW